MNLVCISGLNACQHLLQGSRVTSGIVPSGISSRLNGNDQVQFSSKPKKPTRVSGPSEIPPPGMRISEADALDMTRRMLQDWQKTKGYPNTFQPVIAVDKQAKASVSGASYASPINQFTLNWQNLIDHQTLLHPLTFKLALADLIAHEGTHFQATLFRSVLRKNDSAQYDRKCRENMVSSIRQGDFYPILYTLDFPKENNPDLEMRNHSYRFPPYFSAHARTLVADFMQDEILAHPESALAKGDANKPPTLHPGLTAKVDALYSKLIENPNDYLAQFEFARTGLEQLVPETGEELAKKELTRYLNAKLLELEFTRRFSVLPQNHPVWHTPVTLTPDQHELADETRKDFMRPLYGMMATQSGMVGKDHRALMYYVRPYEERRANLEGALYAKGLYDKHALQADSLQKAIGFKTLSKTEAVRTDVEPALTAEMNTILDRFTAAPKAMAQLQTARKYQYLHESTMALYKNMKRDPATRNQPDIQEQTILTAAQFALLLEDALKFETILADTPEKPGLIADYHRVAGSINDLDAQIKAHDANQHGRFKLTV